MATKKALPAQYVTGPKKSRRFGVAINVQFGTPGESCLWDCIYCPWHDSKKAKSKKAPPRPIDLVEALKAVLKKNSEVSAVLLGGGSEPTIHPEFVEIFKMIHALRKQTKGKWKIILLSNGVGLSREEIRDACAQMDQVWIKLDCASDAIFKKVIRPAHKHRELGTYIDALKKVGAVGIQTTLWKYSGRQSFQNWSADNLRELLELYRELSPQNIHLLTLKRKKLHEGTQPVSVEEMEGFAQRISDLGLDVDIFP